MSQDAPVGVRANPHRAGVLADEARAAELAERPEVAAYLKMRALAWLMGQKVERPKS